MVTGWWIKETCMKSFLYRYATLLGIVTFFVVAALLYLPFATQVGYHDDDWFSMYAAKVAGPQIFRQFYVIESRPARALVVIPLYLLFKGIPVYYAISAYFFRVMGAVTLWWLLLLIWPRNRKETFLVALFFLVYPGFLSQPTPVDFQSYLVGIWIGIFSLVMTVKGVFASNRRQRIFLWVGAVISGWFYLGQIEYYIGFEMVRIFLILTIFLRTNTGLKQKVLTSFKVWLPYAMIPAAFLVWRLFLFENTRKATDLGLQLSQLSATPFHTLLTWFIYFLQDVANVTLIAWSVPLVQLAFNLDPRTSLIALGLSLSVLVLFFLCFPFIKNDADDRKSDDKNFITEALWLGLAWVVFGLVPIIVANRHIIFLEFSRYGLVSSGGAVLFLVAAIGMFSKEQVRRIVIALLLISASITHYANTIRFVKQNENMRSFWWQVSWRVPQFEPRTTIVARYAIAPVKEPPYVWGPANLIYYTDAPQNGAIIPTISSILLDRDSAISILNRDRQYMDPYYLVTAYPNPRNIIVLTQPTPGSCVQIIDGNAPEYSRYENPLFVLIGPYSEMDRILTEEPAPDVPEEIFGSEPEHDWCFYYEKASLARQRGKWDEVLLLALESADKGLKPWDLIEWMPFLQAFAMQNDVKQVARIMDDMSSDEYIVRQACARLNLLKLDGNVRELLDSQYCNVP